VRRGVARRRRRPDPRRADRRAAPARRRAAPALVVGGPEMKRRRDDVANTSRGPLRFRIHYPSSVHRLPMLLYLHGGGWALLHLHPHDRVMREFAACSGWAVVGVDYPLAPEARFPAAVEHCVAVVEWLREEAEAFGLDPARLAIAGDSAGANLALATA